MKVNYALDHHYCETSLLPQAVLNYLISRDFIVKKSVQLKDQFCILTKMKKSVWHCFISEFLNQARAGCRLVHAWFLIIISVRTSVYVCMSATEAINS